jgi:hypothetical protein
MRSENATPLYRGVSAWAFARVNSIKTQHTIEPHFSPLCPQRLLQKGNQLVPDLFGGTRVKDWCYWTSGNFKRVIAGQHSPVKVVHRGQEYPHKGATDPPKSSAKLEGHFIADLGGVDANGTDGRPIPARIQHHAAGHRIISLFFVHTLVAGIAQARQQSGLVTDN